MIKGFDYDIDETLQRWMARSAAMANTEAENLNDYWRKRLKSSISLKLNGEKVSRNHHEHWASRYKNQLKTEWIKGQTLSTSIKPSPTPSRRH